MTEAVRMPVQMFLEEDGLYVRLVADRGDGVQFTVVRLAKRLLDGGFTALQIDYDPGQYPRGIPALTIERD